VPHASPTGRSSRPGVADSSSPSTQDFALARYNPDGSLNGSFGVEGKVDTQDPRAAGAWSAALQPDGKLVVAGGIVARYDSNGSLDPSFGSNGKVALAGNAFGRVVLVQPDGALVVAGALSVSAGNDFLVARLKPNGSVDTSFGTGGQTQTDFGSDEALYAGTLQSDRRIIVAGSSNFDFALARYLNPALVTCRVPSLRGKKLGAARSAITKAHCLLGKVRRKASKKISAAA
jgi:uncharacterized delta-60 repeat protein